MTTIHPHSGRAPGRISIIDLRHRLADPNLIVVDARPTAAYNGWRLNGEARGGHVPGAVAFPISWLASSRRPRYSASFTRRASAGTARSSSMATEPMTPKSWAQG